MSKKVFIGSDHAGFQMKERIKDELGSDFEFIDMGTNSEESVDYPVYAEKVGENVVAYSDSEGVLVCGNGVGIAIAANKINGVRCGLAFDIDSAKHAKLHNDANMVSVAGRSPMMDDPVEIVRAFLSTEFSGEERHARRVKQMMDLEKNN